METKINPRKYKRFADMGNYQVMLALKGKRPQQTTKNMVPNGTLHTNEEKEKNLKMELNTGLERA